MSGGLIALLDDIAALVKLTAASLDDVAAAAGRASAKAAGVVIDDTAVTPRYVAGFAASRELPIIKKIAIGSLRNKLLFILPAALLLSQFLPWLLTPLLMLGGSYLCYEGAEKLWEKIRGHGPQPEDVVELTPEEENRRISGAITTDFILSTEIMVIALNEVASEPLLSRAIILIVVAILITLGVYGVVALIVKMDDIGLRLASRPSATSQAVGRGLVAAMPRIMAFLSTVGIVAMLWVGGHIILVGTHELGWLAPYETVHHWGQAVHDVPGVGGILAWLIETLVSAVIGLVWGAIIVAVLHLIPRRGGHGTADHGTADHGTGAEESGGVAPGEGRG